MIAGFAGTLIAWAVFLFTVVALWPSSASNGTPRAIKKMCAVAMVPSGIIVAASIHAWWVTMNT